ncbi:MAG: HAD-IA family hydrolase, partial [Chloroflexi bacterium]|nr:HAD-IA family hydrolase [Chloroflexota bacterium]
ISDCSADVPQIWQDTPFKPLIDVTIFSFEVGIKKPDRRIYQLACDRLSVSPQDCIYIGDGGSGELTGAAEAGMYPVLIREPSEVTGEAYRPGEEDWQGHKISALQEVLALCPGQVL